MITAKEQPKYGTRHYRANPPTSYNREMFIEARRKLDISRDLLAEIMGISPNVFKQIEVDNRHIPIYVRRMMDLLTAHPELVQEFIQRRG
jgi:DNA-binding transcriptional regulator YiaG